MNNEAKTAKQHRIFGVIIIAIFLAELILCFRGPIAFVHKPTLMLFPPFSIRMEDEEEAEVVDFLERELVLTNSYSVVGHSFIEEYFIRTDPDKSRTKISVKNSDEAQEIARELGLERYAIATVFKYTTPSSISLSIRSVRDGDAIRVGRLSFSDINSSLEGQDENEQLQKFRETITIDTLGIGFTDYLILGLLVIMLTAGTVAVTGKNPGFLIEALIAPAIVLFLFAFIHARSANMDYVQRYIANGGSLKLAQSTTTAHIHALLRYGPILAVGIGYYAWLGIRRIRDAATGFNRSFLDRYIRPWGLFWSVAAAVLFGLSFPSFARLGGMAPLAWISLIPLFLVLLVSKSLKGIFYGVAFGTIQALIVNYWHGTYSYVTLHMITIVFVVEYLMFMVPAVLLIRLSGRWGFLSLPAFWTAFDYLRSSGILGYPWGLAGASQYQFLPLIQIASVTGVWGIGFVVLFFNAGVAWSIAGPALGWKWPSLSKKMLLRIPYLRDRYIRIYHLRRWASRLFPAFVATLSLVAVVVAGAFILRSVQTRLKNAPEHATVVLVQQNTDPRKHEYKKNTDLLMKITDQAIDDLGYTPDLVAWPEGGFKLDITYWSSEGNKNSYWGRVVSNFLEYQKGLGTWLVMGTQDHVMVPLDDGEEEKHNFNSSVLLEPGGTVNAFYHKMRLVPFSEHFPLDKEKYAPLYEMFQEYDISNWSTGESRDVFEHEKMRFATPICFEDVFPDHVRRFVKNDVDVILNMSNDYWSLSPVEGRQHGILSLFRAVENQRPVLRSTASGYTVYVDATGAIQPGAPEPYTEGYAVARVPLPEPHYTFYTKHGDWFPRFCGIASAIAALVACAGLAIGWVKKRKTPLKTVDVLYRRRAG